LYTAPFGLTVFCIWFGLAAIVGNGGARTPPRNVLAPQTLPGLCYYSDVIFYRIICSVCGDWCRPCYQTHCMPRTKYFYGAIAIFALVFSFEAKSELKAIPRKSNMPDSHPSIMTCFRRPKAVNSSRWSTLFQMNCDRSCEHI